MADGSISWTDGVFRAALWRSAPYVSTHTTVQHLVDAGGQLVARSGPLVTSVTSAGACDCDDFWFPSIAEGPVITVMTVQQVSGAAGGTELPQSDQRLLCFANRGFNLPFTPSGRPVKVQVSNSAARLFVP